MPRPLLVVSHEASRTGAPKVALDVLTALRDEPYRRIAVLRWGGPLARDFRQRADGVVLEPLRRTRVVLRKYRRARRLAVAVETWAAWLVLLWYRPRLVYLNTVKAASYVRPALRRRVPVILHVHEAGPLASQTLARYGLDGLYARVHLVACSEGVRADLASSTGVPTRDITVVTPAIDVDAVRSAAGPRDPLEPEPVGRPGPRQGTDLLVGACGTAGWRKGVDRFLEVARRVSDRLDGRGVRFVWIGREDFPGLERLVEELGLGGTVQFPGELAAPYPTMAALDVFVHSARQDPYPVAVLEAMALERPVVAFDVGGLRDQVGDAGILVADGDVGAMAGAVVDLLESPERRRSLGARALRHASAEHDAPRMLAAVHELVELVERVERVAP